MTFSAGRACEIDSGQPHDPTPPTRMAEVHNMARRPMVIPGIVQNGLVIPQSDTPLPEGTRVDILIGPAEVMPELQAELAQWEKASTEAWTLLNQWAAEDR